MNQARWDLLIPVLLVFAYSCVMIWFGYYEGKRVAEYNAEKKANLLRLKIAQDKQLYDWERHGL